MADLTHASYSVRGYCALYTAHCATIATVDNGRVVRLDPDSDHPNGGVMCIKGKAAPELVYHPDRLDYPLRRTRPKGDPNPAWQKVSWDQALDEIAEKLLAIRERHGPNAVALAKGTVSGTSIDDAARWLSRFLYSLGSPNWVSTIHVCNWHKDTGFSYTFGMNLPTPDLAHSSTFLLWGHNPSSTSLILAHDIIAARAATFYLQKRPPTMSAGKNSYRGRLPQRESAAHKSRSDRQRSRETVLPMIFSQRSSKVVRTRSRHY